MLFYMPSAQNCVQIIFRVIINVIANETGYRAKEYAIKSTK